MIQNNNQILLFTQFAGCVFISYKMDLAGGTFGGLWLLEYIVGLARTLFTIVPLHMISEKPGACSCHGDGRKTRRCMETRKAS